MFRALLDRRLKGECIAYILEKKEFRGLEFTVNHSVLVPRPDTEILVETAIDVISEQKAKKNDANNASALRNAATMHDASALHNALALRVLDLCTGSGAVAISLKHEMPELEVYATDISHEALETAKANAARLLPNSNIRFYSGDLYNALSAEQFNFHCIVSNPPYIPSAEITTLPKEVQKEPHLALDGGQDGLQLIKRIIEGSANYLCSGGSLLMEADPRQMGTISSWLEEYGFCKIKTYKDISGNERVIGGIYE